MLKYFSPIAARQE